MQSNLSDTLNVLMAKARINSSELARATGLPATTIKRIRNNEQCNPTISTLAPIAQHFSISMSELLGGGISASEGANTLPLLSWANAPLIDTLVMSGAQTNVATELSLSKHSYALPIESNELHPFSLGGVILIDRTREAKTLDYVVVVKGGMQQAVLKKLIIEGDERYLKSLVAGINLLPFTDDYRLLGVVAQYKLDLK
ncbi:MAG TPA: helix-turn-helix domain-containing protein [Gammaproteobacteria bacterium]|nr:helix-turn-helix domain-containing protein [Gammaproteobacteria bacterium]